VILLLLAAVAEPQDDCANAQNQTQMTICAVRDFVQADAALNAQWKRTAALMQKKDATLKLRDGRSGYYAVLLAAQQAWIKYRDANCVSDGYAARGGTMEPMLVAACKAGLTRQRTARLKSLAEMN
jgi:uncharacterized protein YecT (DUF1311 family)